MLFGLAIVSFLVLRMAGLDGKIAAVVVGGMCFIVLGAIGFMVVIRRGTQRPRAAGSVPQTGNLPGAKRFAGQGQYAAMGQHPENQQIGQLSSEAGPMRRPRAAAPAPQASAMPQRDEFEALRKTLAAAGSKKQQTEEQAPPPAAITPAIPAEQPASVPPPREDYEKTVAGAASGASAPINQPLQPKVDSADTEAMHEKLRQRRQEIIGLIDKSKEHLGAVDDYMMRNLGRNTSGCIQAVVNVQRILTALEKRMSEIDSVLAQSQIQDPAYAQFLLNGELRIEADSLTSLINSDPLPPLKPIEWRATLTALFTRISRRRSIFKGFKFRSPE